MIFSRKTKHIVSFFLCLLLVGGWSSCSLKKSLPEGRYRYNGAKVKVKTNADSIATNKLSTDLTAALTPQPNRKILGIPLRLMIYNIGYNKKKDKSFFKKTGEAPVLYDDNTTKEVRKILESVAFNDGFFYAKAESKVKKKEGKRTATVEYTVNVTAPYIVEKVTHDVVLPSGKAAELLNGQRNKSLIKVGNPYRLEALRVERKRLATYMKTQGYYYFEDDILEFTADTSYATRGIHLVLSVKPETPAAALRPFKMGKIRVFPDYEISNNRNEIGKDTLTQENFIYIYDKMTVKAEVLRKAITLIPGVSYDPERHETTLKRLSNLNTFKYVSVRFEQLPNDDSTLDVRIFLTPKVKRTIEAELGGSFKAGLYTTPEATINYTNRNLFAGSEQLKITATGLFNLPLNDSLSYNDRYRILTTFQKPGLWSPFKKLVFSDKTVGNTQAKLDIERQSYSLRFAGTATNLRDEIPELAEFLDNNPDFVPAFALNRAEISLGYNWRKKPQIKHEFNPLKFGYQRSNFTEQEEEESDLILALSLFSSTPQIALSLGDMIYYQPEYIFNLDTRLQKFRQDNYLLRARVALAGNRIINSIDPVLEPEFFQSRYLILEPDFRYLAVYNKKNSFAFRLAPSATIPFNETVILPFFDLYSIGGPSSNRAFVPRTVGPGARPQDNPFEFPFTGIGNLKLETNVEYRYQVTSLVELAAFIDAGNVWQIYQEDDVFGAQFKIDEFYKQLAIGTGIGFRLDFEILLLRFDFAVPLMRPSLPDGQRFVGNDIQLLNKEYRQNNLQFNFAFGYPF